MNAILAALDQAGSNFNLITLAILGGVALLLVFIIVSLYNSLVRKRIDCENGWAQIDVQLKRRYDLIPNLVETVKGYAKHEKETLDSVIRARQQAIDARSVKDQGIAEGLLSGAMRQLFAVAEAYPDLKANQNFLQLQGELSTTENNIGSARQHYNDNVSQYNTAVQSFPSNVIAGMFNFKARDFFEIQVPEERQAPKVSF